ncbi:vitamin D-binding protein [Centroberyx affinis]|uniref:vitamin D-binding protein n=1 Tax=Centroberyx affinis TaxID=166261 RepID=UPI003A5B9F4E
MLRAALCLLLLQSVAAQNEICNVYKILTDEGFKAMFLVSLAQNLQNSSQAELVPGIEEAHAMATMCCSAAATADCGREVNDIVTSIVCSSETLVERNNLKSCCEGSVAEREKCFSGEKAKFPHNEGFQMSPEEHCAGFKKDNKAFMQTMIFSFAKGNAFTPALMILGYGKWYHNALQFCCETAEPHSCLETKDAGGVQPEASSGPNGVNPGCSGSVYAHDCLLLPGTHGYMHEADKCCKLDVFSLIACLFSKKTDPKPEGLSQHYDLPADIQAVCRTYAESPEKAVTNVLYEVSRRHPEASQVVILRYVAAAHQAVAKCCANNDPVECIRTTMADNDLEKAIADRIAHYKEVAAFKKTVGNPGFENSLVIKYTRVIPQASFDVINQASKATADLYAECLETDNDHELLACEDMSIDTMNEQCFIHDAASINAKLAACCNQTYTERAQCILSMEPDTDFQPAEFDAKNEEVGVKLCTSTAEEQLMLEKRLLHDLVRYKTTITGKQIKKICDYFKAMKAKCCAEADKAACFKTETDPRQADASMRPTSHVLGLRPFDMGPGEAGCVGWEISCTYCFLCGISGSAQWRAVFDRVVFMW